MKDEANNNEYGGTGDTKKDEKKLMNSSFASRDSLPYS